MGRWVAAWLALLLAHGAGAEIYRCDDADGGARFTSDPRGCPGARPHTPGADRVVVAPPRPAGPAAAPPDPPADPARLADLLPPAPGGWETTNEAVEIERDPTLRAQGLRASVSRHYGRARGPVSEVCTVEIWSFAEPAQARAVQASLDPAQSWSRVAGALVVLARGIRLEREVGARRGLVPGCRALAESVGAP